MACSVRRDGSGVGRLSELWCIASAASESLSKRFRTAFGRDDPWTVGPRRIVTNVLVVSALELGNPMLLFVLVEADDPSVHGCCRCGPNG